VGTAAPGLINQSLKKKVSALLSFPLDDGA